jgi:hypothetical protein
MNKIKIGGLTYQIRFDDIEDLGKTDFIKSIITIDSKLNEEQAKAALIHEVLHCVNSQLSEKDIEFLAQAIYQIIKDNNLFKK